MVSFQEQDVTVISFMGFMAFIIFDSEYIVLLGFFFVVVVRVVVVFTYICCLNVSVIRIRAKLNK